jgi:hypothetical protein
MASGPAVVTLFRRLTIRATTIAAMQTNPERPAAIVIGVGRDELI